MTFSDWWQSEGMRLFSENPMVLRSNPHELVQYVWHAAQANVPVQLTEPEEPEQEDAAFDAEFRIAQEDSRPGEAVE